MVKKKRGKQTYRGHSGAATESGSTVSFWVVAFLDLLGYSSVLDKIDVFPFPTKGDERQSLEKAFARAIRLRRRLIHEVDAFLASVNKMPDLGHLPPQSRAKVAGLHMTRLVRSPGPDHIILACSLLPRADHFPLRAVFNLVCAAAVATLIQLSLGADDPEDTLPVRGGIDLAVGMLLEPEDFLYSAALARAYRLESRKAVYARTVAGERLIHFLNQQVESAGSGPDGKFQQGLAERIRGMFFRDRDGAIVLDFFGDYVCKNLPHERAQEIASAAWLYVRRAHAYHASAGDDAVTAKYGWLLEYMRPRLSVWGVTE
jgi:hypothetical protein